MEKYSTVAIQSHPFSTAKNRFEALDGWLGICACLVVMFHVHGPTFSGSTAPDAFFSNAFLIHSLNLHDGLPWNGPSWSISSELWTYVVFALLSAWLGLRNWMLLLAAIAAPLLLFHLSGTGMAFFAPFVFALAVLVFSIEGGLLSQVLRSPMLRWLGKLSYSIYLTHFIFVLVLPGIVNRMVRHDLWMPMPLPIGQYVMAFGRDNLEGTLFYGLVLAFTLAFSAFTYRWVETPGRDWTRRWMRGGNPAVAARQPGRVRHPLPDVVTIPEPASSKHVFTGRRASAPELSPESYKGCSEGLLR